MMHSLLTCLALAYAGRVVAEFDGVTLLQATIQEASVKKAEGIQAEPASEYALADALKCQEEKVSNEKASTIADESKPIIQVAAEREQEEVDPPGASTLRATLELMIIAIIFDGMRRLRIQQLEKKDAKKLDDSCASKAQIEEEAAEAAWMEMVSASAAGDSERFEKALSRSPSLARTDAWGCTPLHFAAAGGSAAIAEELLQRAAEVDARDASDETPLHFAARHGCLAVCEALLEAKADIDAVSAQDLTPLVIAGQANQEPVCRLLADRGAGVAGLADEQLPPLVVSQFIRKVFAA